jgi:hypothetical protein
MGEAEISVKEGNQITFCGQKSLFKQQYCHSIPSKRYIDTTLLKFMRE